MDSAAELYVTWIPVRPIEIDYFIRIKHFSEDLQRIEKGKMLFTKILINVIHISIEQVDQLIEFIKTQPVLTTFSLYFTVQNIESQALWIDFLKKSNQITNVQIKGQPQKEELESIFKIQRLQSIDYSPTWSGSGNSIESCMRRFDCDLYIPYLIEKCKAKRIKISTFFTGRESAIRWKEAIMFNKDTQYLEITFRNTKNSCIQYTQEDKMIILSGLQVNTSIIELKINGETQNILNKNGVFENQMMTAISRGRQRFHNIHVVFETHKFI